MSDRKAPSGPVTSTKGTLVIAATAVAVTAGATATGAFVPNTTSGPNPQCAVGDVVALSPQANLTNTSLGITFARVVSAGIIVVGFLNVGANATQAQVTFDVECYKR
jgi:hypothetical protein